MNFPMSKATCDRCGGPTNGITIMSWFTTEIICLDCATEETDIKNDLRAKGISDAMEGCGYLPDPSKL